jgi:hypothetical protein
MAIYHILAAQRDPKGFKNRTDFGNKVFTLELDAVLGQEEEYGADVTQNVIEDGSQISDHVSKKPLTVTVEGVVTNTPANFAKVGASLRQKSPADEAKKALVKLYEEAIPFVFVGIGPGNNDVFLNMVITSLNVPHRVGTGQALVFSCRMQQIKVVQSNEIKLEKIAVKDIHVAAPITDVGFQPTGTFQNVQTTAKVLDSDIGKFTRAGGSYPLPKSMIPKGIGAKLPGVP